MLTKLLLLTWCCMMIASSSCLAQGFSAFVSPPRFELQAKPGQKIREVIEIHHASTRSGRYRIYTNDWSFGPDHAVLFRDELAADSCRPWVAIERRELRLDPGAKYRYRFEIEPPPGTPPRECRFAIMIEGLEPASADGAVKLLAGGRIAVIVYVAVSDAKPSLSIEAAGVEMTRAPRSIFLDVSNKGNAHGRLGGVLSAVDAKGLTFELAVPEHPILPGSSRRIHLQFMTESGSAAPIVQYPIRLKGSLDYGLQRLPIDLSIQP